MKSPFHIDSRIVQFLVPSRVAMKNGLIGLICCFAVTSLTQRVMAQSDDFNDGNDNGWTRYAKGHSIVTFTNGGYRLQGTDTNGVEAQVFTYRTNEYTDCYASVDFNAWDTNSSSRAGYGIGFRLTDIGPDTTMGYSIYWTPAVSGGGAKVFGLVAIITDVPFVVCATITLPDPTHSYRMVASAVGDFVEGKIYDKADLTKPIAYVSTHDSFFPNGKCALFALTRGDLNNGTNYDVTFDNYYAAAVPPSGVADPGIPHPVAGTPQVVNRVPTSNKNFHPPASGISFNATTLSTNAIAPSAIQLLLNGADVSSALNISGTASNRTVSYTGLASNKLYQARIVLTETGGKSSTNDFYFDTFSESFVTSSAVKIVEAEDFNYSAGQYQNSPLPSGLDGNGSGVNGGGVGYYGLAGTPSVDFSDTSTSPDGAFLGWSMRAYRDADPVATAAGAIYQLTDSGATLQMTNDTPLQFYSSLGLPDYHVRNTKGGEWLNYTRVFSAGRRQVYLRLASIAPQDVFFDEVTSDRTVAGQTTTNLGKFIVVNTGHPSTFRYFQLVDQLGNPVTLDWSGEKTFRLTMGGIQQDLTKDALQLNYMMFVPAPLVVPSPFSLVNPQRNGTTFNVSFPTQSGFTYTLWHKDSLSDLNWISGTSVVGDGTTKTLQDITGEASRVYRVSAQ